MSSYVFLRKEQGTASEPKHKLAQVATGPYSVKKSGQDTVVIAIGDQEERVSRDRVELAPSAMDYAPITDLRQALQFLRGPERNEGGQVIEDENHPDLHESGNSREDNESEDPQKGEGNDPGPQGTSENTEYVINKVIDHDYQDEKLFLKVDWYGYAIEDATWEPIEQLPRSAAVTYFRRKKLSLPAQIAQAQSG